jgi:hypothetical protein
VLLEVGHICEWAVDPEIAARHHHRIACRDDRLELIDGGPGLDLGHEQRSVTDDDPDPLEILGGANE